MLSRRQFIINLSTATALISAGLPIRTSAQGKKRPNIIFIMSDDHAAHAISNYGSRINQTPHIDRLAHEGVRFENCFCTNSICAPSRAVILTGKYSHINGVMVNKNRFDGRQQTFPKLLRQAGYATALIGKWHLKGDPTGFDYWNILPGQGSYHNPVMIENGKQINQQGYVTDIITDHVLNWLKTRSTTKPFYLMIHHKAPHADWITDTKHAGMYSDHDPNELQNIYHNIENNQLIDDLKIKMKCLKKKYTFN
jgi:arylsulfatase A-like enzyme